MEIRPLYILEDEEIGDWARVNLCGIDSKRASVVSWEVPLIVMGALTI